MIKRLFALLMLGGGLAASHLPAAEPTQPQTRCPIQGGEIDPKVYVDYQGKRIYFCCPGCDEKFLAKADEHLARMAAAGIAVAKAPPAHCPVSGEEVDPEVTYVHEGKTYTFCCKRCVANFKREPAKYLAPKAKADDRGAKHDGKDDDRGAKHDGKDDAHRGHGH